MTVTGMNFTVNGRAYGDPKVDEEDRLLDDRSVRLRDLGLASLVIVSSQSMTLATIGGTYWNYKM